MKITVLSKNQIDELARIFRCKHSVSQVGINEDVEVIIEYQEWNGESVKEIIPI